MKKKWRKARKYLLLIHIHISREFIFQKILNEQIKRCRVQNRVGYHSPHPCLVGYISFSCFCVFERKDELLFDTF